MNPYLREKSDQLTVNISITIAKIADTVIIREEADLDKFAEKFVRKLNQQRIIIG